jgi:tetratricopeptide (TPR) repeat protein
MLAFLFFTLSSWSQEHFNIGLEASKRKDFETAITNFEKVVSKEPENVSALVNLGNAYYENKYFGKAILNYEKALKIQPTDVEISQNIEACYSALNIQEVYRSPYGKIESLMYRVGELTWGILSILVAFFSSFSLFQLIRRKGQNRSFFALLFVGSALIMLLFLFSTYKASAYKRIQNHAIITVQDATICENQMGELAGTSLPEGSRIEIMSETKDFYQFKDKSGNVLYVKRSDAERF